MGDRSFCVWTIGSITTLMLGCGSGPGLGRVPLHGTVRVEGVRVEEGSLSLLPLPGHSAPAATTSITGGSYAFTQATGPVPGPHRVVVGVSPSAGGVSAADAGAAAGEPPADAITKAGPQADGRRGSSSATEAASQWVLVLDVPADGDHRADLDFGTK